MVGGLHLCLLVATSAAGESPPPTTTSSTAESIEEITVESRRSERSGSPEAATRVAMSEFALEAADLGQILNRQSGVNVRRSGGLGSSTRLSLNGLSGSQVRIFLDGVPLELAGLPVGIANVPTTLIDEVVVHRGVVPARLGADALGGAFELNTDSVVYGTEVSANYLGGSFGTHRVSATGTLELGDNGAFVRAYGFLDLSDNSFVSQQDVVDSETLQVLEDQDVERFHDGYEGYGASIEAGWLSHSELGTLTVRGFVTGASQDIQQPIVPSSAIAYGEVERGRRSTGGQLRFDQILGPIRVFGAGGATLLEDDFVDLSRCIYDWFGNCQRERADELLGESGEATDSTQRTVAAYARLSAELELLKGHRVRLSIAPTLTQIDGEFRTDRETAQTLQVTADRSLLSAVIGLEYDFALFSERWTTNAFGKWYGLEGQTDVPESVLGSRTEFDVSTFGAGTVTRLRLAGPLDAEASYEFATRLPNPSEYFGTPGAIQPNTNLEPETAHNFNLGLKLNPWNTSIGSFRGEVNGFMRDTSNLIRLEAAASIFFRYGNVTSARSLGGEAALGWTSPGRYLNLNGSLTYMDYRNTSDSGRDAAFNGDRIPNAPYLFGSGTVRFRFSEILQKSDTVELSYSTRFVEEFFLTWESAGEAEFKRRIETQIEASVNLGYRFEVLDQSAAVAVDVQNVFDERLFDFFGIQRPGRAVFVRVSMDALL